VVSRRDVIEMLMRARRTDLALVAALTAVAVVAVVAVPSSVAVVRAIVALPLVFALPGYAIARASLRPHEVRGTELVVLSMALSIATTVLSALVLYVLGVHLRLAVWTALLAVVTLAAVLIGVLRGRAHPLALPKVTLRLRELVALVAALALLAAAAVLGFTPLGPPKGTQGTSAVWILPATEPFTVDVGVISDELQRTTYTVQLIVAGRPGPTLGPFTLAPGARWSRDVFVGSGQPSTQVLLHTAARPGAVYRTGTLSCWTCVTR